MLDERPRGGWIVVLALFACALPVHAKDVALQGFLPFDAARERVLVGACPAPCAVQAPPAVASRGVFRVDGAGLFRITPAASGETTWVATNAPLRDGLVRARVPLMGAVDVALALRARLGASDEIDSGLLVAVEGTRKHLSLRALRQEHGVPRVLNAPVELNNVAATSLELVVVVVGPWLLADLYDGATLLPLAHLAVRDVQEPSGVVGVRFGRAHDAAIPLSLLAVGAATSEHATAWEPAGVERLVVIDADDVARLPVDLRASVATTQTEGGARRAFVVTTPLGQERIARAGVVAVRSQAQMPFALLDPTYRAHQGQPPAPTARGFRVDASYKDAAMVTALLDAYAARYPALTRRETLGTSLEGRPIEALLISTNAAVDEDEPALLLDGAHHGGELLSIEFVIDAVAQLLEGYGQDADLTRMVDGLAIWCVPLVNVDGNARFLHNSRDIDRKNARDIDNNGAIDGWDGVDLYRNYPVHFGALGEVGSRSNPFHYRYRGQTAASEPEVQAMMALAARERFVASIDFHTAATSILVPYTDPSLVNPAPNEAWGVAESIAAQLPVQVNGKRYVVRRNLYPVDGTAQDYFRYAFGTVALLVEGPLNNPLPYGKARDAAVAGTRLTWRALGLRVLRGPSIVVRVRNAAGQPLEAAVEIAELPTQAGERWTSRPRDGRFMRLVPGAGNYTVVVRAAGGGTQTRRVRVIHGAAAVEVTFA